jgi:oligoribonuclease
MPKSPERTQASENLVWLDLEMTGLDVETDVIIQSAVIITNAALEILEEQVWDIWQPEAQLAGMRPFVQDMHAKTGLTERVRASKIDLDKAAGDMLRMISGWCPYGAVLCGNTIWQDRKFVDRYMPGLAGYLGYRMVDVSSLKILAKSWYGPEAVFSKPREGAHDALVDIRNSINELAHYRATLFLEGTR